MKKILTVDVGGTFTKYAVMNDSAKIFERGKIPTPLDGKENFYSELHKLYKIFDVEGIALSLPGVVDSARGILIKSLALNFCNGCNIVDELGKICGCRVTIENDSRCAALAEAKLGALADVDDGFVILFGTMIGGAFIKNHEVYKGFNNSAGEISFIRDDDKIFSDYCSVPALLKNYSPNENITGENFFRAVENDVSAQKILDEFTRKIAEKIFNIQMIIDVKKFAIGGGISAQKIFIDSISENLKKIYAESPVEFNCVEIVPCQFFNDANLIGALMTMKGLIDIE